MRQVKWFLLINVAAEVENTADAIPPLTSQKATAFPAQQRFVSVWSQKRKKASSGRNCNQHDVHLTLIIGWIVEDAKH